MNKIDTIIFVYNGDSSFFAQATAYIQKFIPASTNVCNLCHLSYGKLGMEVEWKRFLKELPYKVMTLHRDEFRLKFPDMSDKSLPTIFVQKGSEVIELLTTDEINVAQSISQLKNLIIKKLG